MNDYPKYDMPEGKILGKDYEVFYLHSFSFETFNLVIYQDGTHWIYFEDNKDREHLNLEDGYVFTCGDRTIIVDNTGVTSFKTDKYVDTSVNFEKVIVKCIYKEDAIYNFNEEEADTAHILLGNKTKE